MPGKMRVTKLRVTSDDKSVECSGTYLLEGQQRFGAPCYTRMGRPGAIYYDGSYWKICRAGNGKTEGGWNFSQRAPADAVPLGQWNRELRTTNEGYQDYSTLTVTVEESEREAASSPGSTTLAGPAFPGAPVPPPVQFGAAPPAFGAPAPAFGTAPAFGGAAQAFGTAPAFGGAAPAFGTAPANDNDAEHLVAKLQGIVDCS